MHGLCHLFLFWFFEYQLWFQYSFLSDIMVTERLFYRYSMKLFLLFGCAEEVCVVVCVIVGSVILKEFYLMHM